MKTIILTIGILLMSVSCSSDDDDVVGSGNGGGSCWKIEYTNKIEYPFIKETNRYPTTESSTNGQIIWISQGLNGYGYEIKCN